MSTDAKDAAMFRWLCEQARLTDYDGGNRGVWDIRGIEGYSNDQSGKRKPFDHGSFRSAVQAAMKKK